jgi:hypothetical protein
MIKIYACYNFVYHIKLGMALDNFQDVKRVGWCEELRKVRSERPQRFNLFMLLWSAFKEGKSAG